MSVVGTARHLVLQAETYLFSDEDEDVRVEMAGDVRSQVPRWFEQQGVDPAELVIALAEMAANLAVRHAAATGQTTIEVLQGRDGGEA